MGGRSQSSVLILGACTLAIASACGEDATTPPHSVVPNAGMAGAGTSGAHSGGRAGAAGGTDGGSTSGRGTSMGGAGATDGEAGAAATDAGGRASGTGGALGTGAGRGGSGGQALGGSGGMPSHPGGEGGLPEGGAGSDDGGAAGSSGTANGGMAGNPNALALTDFLIEPNPNMSISCFVSWKTEVPSSSEVDFGETGYAFRTRDAALVTEHRVLVIGMHAETEYRIRAVSDDGSSSGSAEGTFTTGVLPAGVPVPTLTVDDFAHSNVGWTLTNVQEGTASLPARVVMYDQNGLPVWYFIQGTNNDITGAISTLFTGNSVVVGANVQEPAYDVALSGEVLWQGPPQISTRPQTHYAGKTSTGNYTANSVIYNAAQVGSVKINGQLLEEMTPTYDVVWSWSLLDHVAAAGTRNDYCHGNALQLDEAGGILYYNCRYLGLFKIDRASGDIIWRMGGTFDTTSIGPGDFTYDPPESQFDNAHDPEVHADGTILFYDNTSATSPVGQQFHSRVLEYQVDENTMTATRTFEFPGTFPVDDWYKNTWYTPIWGDADRLANGNILITAGMRSMTKSTRIFEVTRAGAVVWELTFPPNYGSYSAQRLAPLVEALP